MTDQEIARALGSLIREDGERAPEEQIRDLIEGGVIDEHGRVLIGTEDKTKQLQKIAKQNGSSDAPSPRAVPGT
jgi:hypothetical protein